jgi:hypothetical protein
MKRFHIDLRLVASAILLSFQSRADQAAGFNLNRNWPIVDAHNCYPYEGKWADRIDRALSIGLPVAIEMDLAWSANPATRRGQTVISHSTRTTGSEPRLQEYFFERVRPIVETALKDQNRGRWPLIVLHLDFKDVRPELLHDVWNMLGTYEAWLTTAVKGPHVSNLAPLDVKPILVLTEDSDAQAKVFYDDLPAGARLRLFGSVHTQTVPGNTPAERARAAARLAPEQLVREKATNYRRWWNNSWHVVEEGGPRTAGDWTPAEERRLRRLVNHAHKLGLWIRFYTLNGTSSGDREGWNDSYNFGSNDAVLRRWKAARNAGVDFIATDQYEELARQLSAPASKQKQ